jgi:excisionase family DNA binding protein
MRPRTLKRPATIEHVALHYGVTIKTVRRWIAAGLLTAYRVGPHAIRVDMTEAEELAKPVTADTRQRTYS